MRRREFIVAHRCGDYLQRRKAGGEPSMFACMLNTAARLHAMSHHRVGISDQSLCASLLLAALIIFLTLGESIAQTGPISDPQGQNPFSFGIGDVVTDSNPDDDDAKEKGSKDKTKGPESSPDQGTTVTAKQSTKRNERLSPRKQLSSQTRAHTGLTGKVLDRKAGANLKTGNAAKPPRTVGQHGVVHSQTIGSATGGGGGGKK
jgi:hypothetical protein